jgi:hypothetical protein
MEAQTTVMVFLNNLGASSITLEACTLASFGFRTQNILVLINGFR